MSEQQDKSQVKHASRISETVQQLVFPGATEKQERQEQPTSKKRANELDGKTWTRYSISIWSGIRKTPEELALKHPALFPSQLVSRLIECFTTREERVILDPFAGVGSTIVAAHRMGRKGIGVELEPRFVQKGLARIDTLLGETGSIIHCDDVRNLLKYVEPNSVDLVVTSPPYWNILLEKRTADYKPIRHYGSASQDLGKIDDYWEFLKALADIFRLVSTVLKPGKFCCVVVMDIRKKDQFFPYHADLARLLHADGFMYEDIIIWDRRHEYNNMRPLGYPYRFRINKAHEYILVFRKPESQEVNG